ncbi:MAG: hypothetical protein R3B97_13220 [Dehalococcoidia bacterium]
MPDALTCLVCLEPLTATTEAWCQQCGGSYHLNQRSDLPGKDCGDVWINEESMALEFSCNRCINTPAPGLDDILDLAEAAGVVGLSPAALAEAADGGQVAHRKTGCRNVSVRTTRSRYAHALTTGI